MLSRAYTLFQLAIEEIGKCYILSRAILDYYMGTMINEDYLKGLGFCNHKIKTKESLELELRAIQAFEKHIGLEIGLIQVLINDVQNVDEINKRKNRSLYVDIEENKFVSPISEITKEIAEEIQDKAIFRLKAIEPIWQPLSETRKIAEKLKIILEDPKKLAEMKRKIVN